MLLKTIRTLECYGAPAKNGKNQYFFGAVYKPKIPLINDHFVPFLVLR